MPIKRKQGETKDEFIGRCIAVEITSGKSEEQAVAICYAYWEEKQLMAVKNIRRKKIQLAKDQAHYTEDGKLWTGPTHKHNGRLMTGATHTENSEYLYHEKEMSFEKTRVFVDSSNVDRLMYDDIKKEMVIKFADGSFYTYFDISQKTFDSIIDGNAVCKTDDSQTPPRWWEGKSPSVGAAVHKYLIKKGVEYTTGGSFR